MKLKKPSVQKNAEQKATVKENQYITIAKKDLPDSTNKSRKNLNILESKQKQY